MCGLGLLLRARRVFAVKHSLRTDRVERSRFEADCPNSCAKKSKAAVHPKRAIIGDLARDLAFGASTDPYGPFKARMTTGTAPPLGT